jgi:DNA (cytosine-5)-methyltransferase 1
MLRVISEIKPTYVVGENVRGLTNWNGGVVFEEVCTDLENQGYTVQPILLPACAVGAPHRRDRIWFVAYSKGARARENIGGLRSEFERCNTRKEDAAFITNSNNFGRRELCIKTEETWSCKSHKPSTSLLGISDATNSQRDGGRKDNRIRESRFNNQNSKRNDWQNFPTQSPICGGNDGLSIELDGITFSKWRNESIKGYGNAIVPQVAYEIFKVIAEMDAREKAQLKLF